MTEFEKILQECLRDLEQGVASVDECLRRYPQHARQLEPVLLASLRLERAGEMRVSEAFKARVRSRLAQEMQRHPQTSRQKPSPASSRFTSVPRTAPLVRAAAGLAAILLALLATGTVYAQSALPGQPFYGWKLASEDAWRTVSPDPVGTDLLIAERRASELIAVKDDPDARARTLESYLETVDRLRSEAGTEDQIRIASTLDSQRALLKKLGILLSQSDPNEVPPVVPVVPEDATVAPTALPTAQTPGLVATALPSLTPTLPAPPEVLFPTIDVPPELVPTIHVPPPIR